MSDWLQLFAKEDGGESFVAYALVAEVVAVIVNPELVISTLHRLADLMRIVAGALTFLA